MKRRGAVVGLAALLLVPQRSSAQRYQEKVPHVGILGGEMKRIQGESADREWLAA
jgi:hypothetical protein